MSKMNNGATVLQRKASSVHHGCEVVLCSWGDEFVTWYSRDGECFWGHYFSKLTAAAQDFDERF